MIGRSDGEELKKLGLTRRFMPLLMPRRNDSVVYYEQKIRMEALEQFRDDFEKEHGVRLSLLHCVLYTCALRMRDRPYMNRFTKSGRAYQRHGVWMSFAAKRKFEDGAALRVIKKQIDPDQSLLHMVQQIDGGIEEARHAKKTTTDTELKLLFMLPNFVVKLLLKFLGFLDYFGVMPKAMIRSDPMYSSMFIAHLGSVGLDSAYHHLYEYGTIPIFLVIGKTKEEPVVENGEVKVGRVATFRYSYDERIADGFYTASTLEGIQEILENPKEHLANLAPTAEET